MSDTQVISDLLAATRAGKLKWTFDGEVVASRVADIAFSARIDDVGDATVKVERRGGAQGEGPRIGTIHGSFVSDVRDLFDVALESATSRKEFLADVHRLLADEFGGERD
ncbi:hypothetical protein [Streptomyces iconiensis]|uniref:Uncharacterized protein n=1 Tax=Streptomyces iconiensis TaxID=1384038 RepID=A0ABT7A0A2_9ACTN|nr:hypothetical protein [Streptomyces iconiensis]MDJ1134766.1 hypothetical protein [Streptomyces iconiensis]